jgi:hypothetical protein
MQNPLSSLPFQKKSTTVHAGSKQKQPPCNKRLN